MQIALIACSRRTEYDAPYPSTAGTCFAIPRQSQLTSKVLCTLCSQAVTPDQIPHGDQTGSQGSALHFYASATVSGGYQEGITPISLEYHADLNRVAVHFLTSPGLLLFIFTQVQQLFAIKIILLQLRAPGAHINVAA
jgi:hypothetical protein